MKAPEITMIVVASLITGGALVLLGISIGMALENADYFSTWGL